MIHLRDTSSVVSNFHIVLYLRLTVHRSCNGELLEASTLHIFYTICFWSDRLQALPLASVYHPKFAASIWEAHCLGRFDMLWRSISRYIELGC
jgi:hypothetical protein